MDNKNLRKSIQKLLKEGFFNDENFDTEEMMGNAQQAAKKDIEDSGEEFEPIGSSKFEKKFDINSFLKDLKHSPKISSLNEKSQIDRPKDAEGQPLTIRTRVEDIETGNAGKIIRFGADDSGKLTVHVEWLGEFGGNIPKSITYPDKIVVRDSNRIVREVENQEETEGHSEQSRYMFFSNLEQIKRQAESLLKLDEDKINEILENGHDWAQDHIATAKESIDQVYDFLINENEGEEIEEGIGTGLSLNIKHVVGNEDNIDEDSLAFRNKDGQREKNRKDIPLGKHAPHSQVAINETGLGIGNRDLEKGSAHNSRVNQKKRIIHLKDEIKELKKNNAKPEIISSKESTLKKLEDDFTI